MRRLQIILMACLVASSLFTAAGTAWAQSASFERGTSWTESGGPATSEEPTGAGSETLAF